MVPRPRYHALPPHVVGCSACPGREAPWRTRMEQQKTWTPRPGDLDHRWWVVDATDLPLGRLASEVARLLRGKHKPTFSPHMDGGDYVVVVNAEKVGVTGAKAEQKRYYRHSGYPGGLSERGYAHVMATHPERIIERAVRGMIPKNRLGRRVFKKLKVYAGPDHPHFSQQPEPLTLEMRKVEP